MWMCANVTHCICQKVVPVRQNFSSGAQAGASTGHDKFQTNIHSNQSVECHEVERVEIKRGIDSELLQSHKPCARLICVKMFKFTPTYSSNRVLFVVWS